MPQGTEENENPSQDIWSLAQDLNPEYEAGVLTIQQQLSLRISSDPYIIHLLHPSSLTQSLIHSS
jgi:hypothetical protein